MKIKYFLLVIVSFFLGNMMCCAVPKSVIEWQKTIGGSGDDNLTILQQTSDGGYILGGFSNSNISGNKSENSKGGADYWVIKLDAFANIEWQKTYGGIGEEDLRVIKLTQDGGYLLCGYSTSGISGDKTENSNGSNDIWIIKINAAGDIQWQNSIGGSDNDLIYTMQLTPDGGCILGATSSSNISGDKTENSYGGNDYWVVKLNNTGSIIWQKTIGGSNDDIIRSIEPTSDDGYILVGISNSGISGNKTEINQGNYDQFIVKIDAVGNIQWQNTIGGNAEDFAAKVIQTPDNNFIISGASYSPISGDKTEDSYNGNSDLWILKLNTNGNIIWQKTIGGDLWDATYDFKPTTDGGYIIAANSNSNLFNDKTEGNFGVIDYWVLKLDAFGNIQWQNTIGGSGDDYVTTIQQTIDGGYIAGGYSPSSISGKKNENSKGGNDFWIVKLLEDPRYITGNIFTDFDNNCTQNPSDKGLHNYSIKANKGSYTSFTTSDSLGKYSLAVKDTGNYNLQLIGNFSYPFYEPANCNIYNIHLQDSIDTINFAMRSFISCSLNTVNIAASSVFRRCRENTYYVTYSNNGTIASSNTYIDIALDRWLQLNNSTKPYTALGNNVFRFLIGSLDFLQSGTFSFNATPICDSTILGQTLCTEAHIFPDTVCISPNYLGSIVVSSARCLGDSVELKLLNKGNNMQQLKKYIVIEGDVVRMRKDYQLPTNGTVIVKMPANQGKTYRIIAEQESILPDAIADQYTTAAIEACRSDLNNSFDIGYIPLFPNYDGEPFRSVSCNTIIGSYDPNDKVPSPLGYGINKYVEANTDINYTINFQNTGNDTAFKVVIIDTITPVLDINSIQLETASHPYQFERIDTNVIRFVFDSINLVDSFKNEQKSHGFVKFRIGQRADNPDGTKIYNSANIYFDYNAPIITNKTMHTIGRDFVQVNLIPTKIDNTKFNIEEVKVYPNPFRDKTQIIVIGDILTNAVLNLIDIEGKTIKTVPINSNNGFEVYREDLINGTYIYKVIQDSKEIVSGKILIQ